MGENYGYEAPRTLDTNCARKYCLNIKLNDHYIFKMRHETKVIHEIFELETEGLCLSDFNCKL